MEKKTNYSIQTLLDSRSFLYVLLFIVTICFVSTYTKIYDVKLDRTEIISIIMLWEKRWQKVKDLPTPFLFLKLHILIFRQDIRFLLPE